MMHRKLALLAATLLPTLYAQAQTTPALQVEVATIHPSDPNDQSRGFHIEDNGHRAFIENMPVAMLITIVYGLQADQLLHVPGWANTERFDIHATAPGSATPDWEQWRQMAQALLIERFHLRVHEETRDLPIDSLTVDKHGLRIQPSTQGKNELADDTMNGYGNLRETNTPMKNFAATLGHLIERPVVDNTGLADQRFDFTLHWRDTMQNPQAASDDSAALPDLRTALVEQAGLRLTATHGPVRVVVVDTLDHPTAN